MADRIPSQYVSIVKKSLVAPLALRHSVFWAPLEPLALLTGTIVAVGAGALNDYNIDKTID